MDRLIMILPMSRDCDAELEGDVETERRPSCKARGSRGEDQVKRV